jgi:hypothetical protein
MRPKNGWFIPPIKGLLEPVSTPTPDDAVREALSLITYDPEKDQRKPKRNSKAKRVESQWRPEDDLTLAVLKAFEKKEKRK